uniref:Uncharacterized protein n=2 Tax=Cacopsylla melanoneura TaxID=428564 RepID=A0A8D9E813_9HEMI
MVKFEANITPTSVRYKRISGTMCESLRMTPMVIYYKTQPNQILYPFKIIPYPIRIIRKNSKQTDMRRLMVVNWQCRMVKTLKTHRQKSQFHTEESQWAKKLGFWNIYDRTPVNNSMSHRKNKHHLQKKAHKIQLLCQQLKHLMESVHLQKAWCQHLLKSL